MRHLRGTEGPLREPVSHPRADDPRCRSLSCHAVTGIASFRREWVRQARGKRGDGEGFRAAINWSTWSRVGRPLLREDLRAMNRRRIRASHRPARRREPRVEFLKRQAEYPSATRSPRWREQPMPETRNDRLYLYLSGAGGTGKSCLLRAPRRAPDQPNAAFPVWYRVDAPNSTWSTVEKRAFGEELEAAAELKFKARAGHSPSGASKLRIYLSQLRPTSKQ